MVRTNLEKLLDRDGDIGMGELSLFDLRTYKMDPLSAITDAMSDDLLSVAVRHSWNVTLFMSRIC
jgi:hypothetical protein